MTTQQPTPTERPEAGSWSELILGCIEALEESLSTVQAHPEAEDRQEAARAILMELAGDIDQQNYEMEDAGVGPQFDPTMVAGDAYTVYLASTVALQDKADRGVL